MAEAVEHLAEHDGRHDELAGAARLVGHIRGAAAQVRVRIRVQEELHLQLLDSSSMFPKTETA